jgi:hypothetical protein
MAENSFSPPISQVDGSAVVRSCHPCIPAAGKRYLIDFIRRFQEYFTRFVSQYGSSCLPKIISIHIFIHTDVSVGTVSMNETTEHLINMHCK